MLINIKLNLHPQQLCVICSLIIHDSVLAPLNVPSKKLAGYLIFINLKKGDVIFSLD